MMQASELAEQVVSAANIATCDGYYEIDTDKVTAIIEQAKARWIAEERATIVAWLRSHECALFVPEGATEPFDESADAIERGEHCNATAIRADKGTGDAG